MTVLALVDDLRSHWWIYVSMPLTVALVGYVTKIVAIEMLYRPLEFVGRRPVLGWQGVIPRKAAKMAAIAVDTFVGKLLKPEELFDRIDPQELVRQIERPLLEAVEEIAEEVVSQQQPGVWEAMPGVARRTLIRRIHGQAPALISNLTDQLRTNLDDVFDLKHMVVSNLVRDKALLNSVFRDAAAPGMRFIIRSGAIFGFVIGLMQMTTFVVTGSHWVLPLYGIFAGSFTDWLALQMCFRPMERRRFLGLFRWHGIFHAERAQITEKYGRLLAEDLLTPAAIIESLLTGPKSDRLFELVQREVKRTVDAQAGIARPFMVLAVGGRGYQELKQAAADRVIAKLPETARHAEAYAAEALDVRNTVVERMGMLSTVEYEELLRPAVKDDEWIIVAVGAVLGFLVGELQLLLVTHVA